MVLLRKTVLLVFLLACLAHETLAQVPEDSISSFVPKFSLSLLPSGFLDPIHAVLGLRADFRPSLKQPLTIGLELAALRPNYQSRNNEENPRPLQFKNGILLKPALRYFYYGDPKEGMLFAEVQGLYKYMRSEYEDWVLIDLPSGAGSYEQFSKIQYRHNIYGCNILVGVKSSISQRQRKLFFEIFGGTGFRYRQRERLSLPENGTLREEEDSSPGNFLSSGWRLTVQGGIRLGWNF